MNDVQIIRTSDGNLIVLSERDYDALLARAGDDAAEDRMTARIIAENQGRTALPGPVLDRILDGESAVAVLLEFRGLTQAELAQKAGLSQPFISKLARGVVGAGQTSLRKLSLALEVSLDVLVG